ncbi:helix-turn-helix domain containing protein [Sulfitobacter sp. F26169L]|uniref:TetR/AcrR family transcriptional regulator n=1 Tax=Sulfitobacter sp. F26169L TaxID=2996015 RepID=UPI002260DA8F|nr:helix-turn-helix domain-containing protein [Sulfitobacter sp. F26169L]MCX7567913.1 helix-turn-helix domain containing protein [Sulfitobacter sp. F26169L]
MAKADRTKETIFNAAMKLFGDTGGECLGVSDLAHAANLSRGTIYNNLDDPSVRFDDLTPILARDLEDLICQSFEGIGHPADRIAIIIKTIIKRAHREPVWADFVKRYVLVDTDLQKFWSNVPASEVRRGQSMGLFENVTDDVSSIISVMGGSTLIGMLYVRQGVKGWRDTGTEIAELVLRSLGMDKAGAHKHARIALPDVTNRMFSMVA